MPEGFDQLTGIWDRKTVLNYIFDKIEKKINLGVALADVDFFVNIDSKVGSLEGDKILQRIVQFLSDSANAVVGRYSGDEFLLVYENKEEQELLDLLTEVRKKFRKQRFISETSIYAKAPLTISIGMALYGNEINNTTLLLKSAEIALATAKKMGRNQVAVAPRTINIITGEAGAVVSTVIGAGLRGYGGDDGPVNSASLLEPYGVDLIESGEMVFADRGNHRIRKIKNGIVETIAGNGIYGYAGDNGPAVEAGLNKPSGVAVGKDKRIYIADTGNHCIRQVDTAGIITTLAGCGSEGYEGDGGKACLAKLSRPGGVVVDYFGNVYTNDYGNNVIRMINNEGIIHTVAGSGAFGFSGDGGHPCKAALNKPYGLAVSYDGKSIFIADYGNNCIRHVYMPEERIETICGTGDAGYSGDGGAALKATLNGPYWISFWGEKYILIADAGNHCIRFIDMQTKIIHTLVGNGTGGYRDGEVLDSSIGLNLPAGMIADIENDTLYIADYANNAIRKLILKNYRWGR